ncbi:MAG: hypothetical protein IJ897_07910 [Prevotella sp.]|nr:hypothetical protein [Prevotella sp.]
MELYRERSYARCIAEGWGFLGKNLWKVIKIMSPWYVVCALLYAVVNACSIYLNVADQANTEVQMEYVYVGLTAFGIVILLSILAQGRLYLMFCRMSGKEKDKTSNIVVLGLKSSLFLWLVWTPFFFPLYSWIMKDKWEKISFKQTIKKGWNHWGKILGVVLLSGLILCVVNLLLMMPYTVATSAYLSSIEGKINFGDQALIPDSGYATMLIACTLCYAVILLISVAHQTTLLYLYGDLKTREK